MYKNVRYLSSDSLYPGILFERSLLHAGRLWGTVLVVSNGWCPEATVDEKRERGCVC